MSDMQAIFSKFIENLAIDESDLGHQITEWKECLEKRESIEFVRKSGSTKRGTSINASSDIDLVVLYHKDEVNKKDINNFFEFAKGEIRGCIPVNQNMDHGFKYDYIGGTDIDVVIGYSDEKNPFVFWIPDRRNGKLVWIETSPDASEKRIKDANRLTSGNAGKYVRLMKYWNNRHQKRINSFHLETLVIKKILTDSETFNNLIYPEGLLYLFESLFDAIKRKEPHPAGKGPNLGELSEKQIEDIRNTISYSIRMTELALEKKDIREKIIYWKNIFGYDLTK